MKNVMVQIVKWLATQRMELEKQVQILTKAVIYFFLGKAEINLVSNPAGIEPKYRANICLNCMDLIHIKYCPRMTGYQSFLKKIYSV